MEININLLKFIYKATHNTDVMTYIDEITHNKFVTIWKNVLYLNKGLYFIDNFLLEKLITIYYSGNSENKTINDINNEFIIKSLLE
jgi:hypothetical protein